MRVTQNQMFLFFLLFIVYLSLNGELIPNDGYVLVTDIGTDDGGLLCHTDRIDCCRSSDGAPQGHWYFPDGSPVGIKGQVIANDPTTHFFFRDRNTGVVRLNRYGNPVERGRFRCEVPDRDGVNVIMYVNIGEFINYCHEHWIIILYEVNCSHEVTN